MPQYRLTYLEPRVELFTAHDLRTAAHIGRRMLAEMNNAQPSKIDRVLLKIETLPDLTLVHDLQTS